VSAGEIAGLIAAIAFVLLVGLLAVPILKLGRTLDETTKLVSGVNERTMPLLTDVSQTMRGVNVQLEKVDTITTHAESVTTNVAALASLFAATLGGPLVRVAALSYGLRRAVVSRRRGEVSKRVTEQIREERRASRRFGRRRRAAAGGAGGEQGES
jgi:uncharacterized protein YoxC